MQKQFDLHALTRGNIFGITRRFDLKQLNKIPMGFNNNLAWNLGHILVSQQLLCYTCSGIEMLIDEGLVDKYRRGTRPEGPVDQELVDYFFAKLKETAEQLPKDYAEGKFQTYNSYLTKYRMELHSIEDAIIFNNLHEAMHIQAMLTMIRFL